MVLRNTVWDRNDCLFYGVCQVHYHVWPPRWVWLDSMVLYQACPVPGKHPNPELSPTPFALNRELGLANLHCCPVCQTAH